MRKYDVAYVPNGPVSYYPPKSIDDMSLEEIKRKYIKTCAKANGDVSVCSKCLAPCKEGKRAIQLTANEVYNNPPIPLYGGKTLIEKAREENIRRREKMEEQEKETLEKRKKYNRRDGWWEDSIASGDQIKWLKENMGLSMVQAKKKIYQYKYLHKNTETKKSEEKADSLLSDARIETKLEALLSLQEEHKKAMENYMSLYLKEQEEYNKIKYKTDILCNAMDIMNDILQEKEQ